VLGEKGLAEGKVELKWRWDKDPTLADLEGISAHVAALIAEERQTQSRFGVSKEK